VAVVDTQTDGVACLSDPDEPPLRVRELRWLSDSRVAAVTAGSGPHIFERDGSQWKRSSDKLALPVAPRALEVSIQQALDLPPAVFAKDVASGKEARIFDPNPQLAGIDLGSVEPYSWKDRHGRVIRAGLVKPPKLVPGRRYPLVIQTHGFRGDRFFRVGFSDTSNAGRALAGRGIVVLQVAEPFEPYEGTSEEGEENGTQVYLSAIDKLSAEGLIDPTKVGITGYSRMGFFAAKAITDAPDRFAAAVIANADPGSLVGYFSYIDYIMPTYARNAAELFAGELPYAEGMEQWLKKTPGFRTELIRAPVLISAADPQHLISLWGLYAPLRDQRKPVELQYIRSGSHNISKPLQKLAHQDLIVDWFDFWLNGHEDPSEHKAAQYRRWKAWAGSDKGN
jgi:dipeptidyl aminopeptidase/acylaminoacyl peptidase